MAQNKKPEEHPEPSDQPNGLDAAALQRQLEAMAETMKQLQARIDTQSGKAPAKREIKKTEEDGEYVATARGHIPGLGVIEPKRPIPAGIPIGSWMKKAAKKKVVEEAEGDDD